MLNQNLPSQRIIIVGDGSMFEEGLSRLLTFNTDLQVSGSGYKDDSSFLEDFTQSQPDVIVLNASSSIDSVHMLELLYSIPLLVSLCIIIVRLGNNMVDVYEIPKNQISAGIIRERRQFTITKRDDLLAVMRGTFQHI